MDRIGGRQRLVGAAAEAITPLPPVAKAEAQR
jgi:hypothetical protein